MYLPDKYIGAVFISQIHSRLSSDRWMDKVWRIVCIINIGIKYYNFLNETIPRVLCLMITLTQEKYEI